MPYTQDLIDLIDERIRVGTLKLTASGTVVTRTGATTAMVTFDGSTKATPVKVFGDVNVDQGDRVGMVRLGVDWTIIGTFTRRRSITMPDGATTGTQRMVFGGDTPPELAAYGLTVALTAYVTSAITGVEMGYFFIGVSNIMDAAPGARALVFGNVSYPTPGQPSSATVAQVKTNHQMDMWAQFPQTVIKDHDLVVWTPAGAPAPPRLWLGDEVDGSLHVVRAFNQGGLNGVAAVDTLATGTNTPLNEFGWGFKKYHDDTTIKISVHMGLFVSAGGNEVTTGIQMNGTDYDCARLFFNTASQHQVVSGWRYVTGIPAGNYSFWCFWRRSTGAGSLFRNANDWISANTEELAI